MLNTLFISIFLTLFPLACFPGLLQTCQSLVIHCQLSGVGFIFLLLLLRGPGDMEEMVDEEAGMLLDLVHPTSQS